MSTSEFESAFEASVDLARNSPISDLMKVAREANGVGPFSVLTPVDR